MSRDKDVHILITDIEKARLKHVASTRGFSNTSEYIRYLIRKDDSWYTENMDIMLRTVNELFTSNRTYLEGMNILFKPYNVYISVRCFNCILRSPWASKTVGELWTAMKETPDKLLKIRCFGKKAFDELYNLLNSIKPFEE